MMSIIIPAHNESAVIRRCLDGLHGIEAEIVVVANGCRDDTVAAARAVAGVRVLETPVASKTHALNLGDEEASTFPRVYLDADVCVSAAALRDVVRALDESSVLAAAPRMRVDTAGLGWAVRAYYAVWLRLPYCRTGMTGAGVYAISEQGRRRWGRFPDVTADDAFVRSQFRSHERRTVTTCHSTVRPPASLGGIVRIKTRSHFGNVELRRRFPAARDDAGEGHAAALLWLALNPLWWPALWIYAYVKLRVRYRVGRDARSGRVVAWERDDSSRKVATP